MASNNSTSEWLRFLTSGLAVYRVSVMVAKEEGPFNLFARWRNYLKHKVKPGQEWIVKGFDCPLCISFWVGWLAAIPLYRSPVQYVRTALSLSGVATVIHKFLG